MTESEDTETQWLYEVLKEVQLEQFYTRIKNELQASFISLGHDIFSLYSKISCDLMY